MDDHKARDAGRSYSTIPRSATQRVPIFVATHKGIGIAGGLRRHAPGEGNNHSRRHLSCIPSRKAECAAMRDLIRGSLAVGWRRGRWISLSFVVSHSVLLGRAEPSHMQRTIIAIPLITVTPASLWNLTIHQCNIIFIGRHPTYWRQVVCLLQFTRLQVRF